MLCVVALVVRVRPRVIVSTGAAPGFFALRIGSLIGAKTLWVDSFANAEELSLSGRKASKFADLALTQWKHLGEALPESSSRARGNAYYAGAVV